MTLGLLLVALTGMTFVHANRGAQEAKRCTAAGCSAKKPGEARKKYRKKHQQGQAKAGKSLQVAPFKEKQK